MTTQCNGTCKNGNQCKRMIQKGRYCKTHFVGECSICLSQIEDHLVKTKCGHFFHKKCLEQWLETANTCPECRYVLYKKYIKYTLHLFPESSDTIHYDMYIQINNDVNDDDDDDIVTYVVDSFYEILQNDNNFQNIVENQESFEFTLSINS